MKNIVLFSGNPGVGKSTLCNCVFQEYIFESGLSTGNGMTKEKQEHTIGDITYIDTPGLADIVARREAAKEIEESLKKEGSYKIIFVIAPVSNRLRADDLATVNAVCESIKANFGYGIILNKISKKAINKFNLGKDSEFLGSLTKKPSSVCLLLKDDDADNADAEEKIIINTLSIRNKLINFISELEANIIVAKEVHPIKIENYKKKVELMEVKVKCMSFLLDDDFSSAAGLVNQLAQDDVKDIIATFLGRGRLEDVLNIASTLSGDIDHMFFIYDLIYKHIGHNSSDVFILGFSLKKHIIPLGGLFESKARSFIANFGSTIEKLIFNEDYIYDIYNTYQKEYLYAADHEPYDDNRRRVFTWIPGKRLKQGDWKIRSNDEGKTFTIYNTYQNEYLYAADHKPFDSDRRRVFTWRPGGKAVQGYWKLKPYNGGSTFTIYNIYQKEYLYAADYEPYDDNRRRVFTWRPGNEIKQGYWKFE